MTKTLSTIVATLLLVSVGFTPLAGQAQVTTTQPRSQQELLAQLLYLYQVLAQLQVQLAEVRAAEARGEVGGTTPAGPNPLFVNVISLAPTSIGRETVSLRGEVDKGGSTYLEVWFQYGEGTRLNRQAELPRVTKSGRQAVNVTIDDLRANTNYSYRLVAEDERGFRHYGQTRTFTTIAPVGFQTFTGRPTAETEGSSGVQATAASVSGFVSMNDYTTGHVFFAYGTNRTDVSDADRYRSFKDIPVATGVMMKKTVNTKFTGRNTVKTSLGSLKRATRYYYRVCVEYSVNNDGVNPYLRCGQVESFTTLN